MVSGLVTSPCDQLRMTSGDARRIRMELKAALRRCSCLEMTTRGTEAAGALEAAVAAAGAARLVFASGSPLYSLGSALMSVQFAALSDADRAAILGENMARLLEGQR